MKEEKQAQNQEKFSGKLQNLHLASQIGGNSVIDNDEINVLIHKHSR